MWYDYIKISGYDPVRYKKNTLIIEGGDDLRMTSAVLAYVRNAASIIIYQNLAH